jgi:hypothetical protein
LSNSKIFAARQKKGNGIKARNAEIFNREIHEPHEKGMRHGWEKAGTFNIKHPTSNAGHSTLDGDVR